MVPAAGAGAGRERSGRRGTSPFVEAALAQIEGGRRVFVHRDYHAQKSPWLPQRKGVARVGLIDFQDAVAGSAAYDLISLIEDARRDVSPEMAEAATAHYLSAMKAQDMPVNEVAFRREMAVMAAQRNAKIVGIFARLYKRDGKVRYLSLLPRSGPTWSATCRIRRWPICEAGMTASSRKPNGPCPPWRRYEQGHARHDHGGGAGHPNAPPDR